MLFLLFTCICISLDRRVLTSLFPPLLTCVEKGATPTVSLALNILEEILHTPTAAALQHSARIVQVCTLSTVHYVLLRYTLFFLSIIIHS